MRGKRQTSFFCCALFHKLSSTCDKIDFEYRIKALKGLVGKLNHLLLRLRDRIIKLLKQEINTAKTLGIST